MLKDPVCGQRIQRGRAYARNTYDGVTYYLCCPRCQADFEADPEHYAQPEMGEKLKTTSKRSGRQVSAAGRGAKAG